MTDPLDALLNDDGDGPDPLYAALAAGHDPLDAIDKLARARPAWQAQAACRGVGPDVFFPARGQSLDVARSYCDRCPVRDDCYSEAVTSSARYDEGIWGGTSARQRKIARTSAA